VVAKTEATRGFGLELFVFALYRTLLKERLFVLLLTSASYSRGAFIKSCCLEISHKTAGSFEKFAQPALVNCFAN
jgi:hypothetical protein